MEFVRKKFSQFKGVYGSECSFGNCFKKTRQKANFIKIPGVVYYNSLYGKDPPMLTTSLGMLDRLNIQKSPSAWEAFVKLYGPLIYKWNINFGLSAEDAKDICQEVLLEVFKKLHMFQRLGKGSFRGWLNQISYYKMMQFKKARKKELDSRPGHHELNNLIKMVSNNGWAEEYCLDVFNRALATLESDLSFRDWTIFQKSFLEQLPPEEVAEQVNCTKSAVYIVHCRALKKLKAVVAKFIEDLN